MKSRFSTGWYEPLPLRASLRTLSSWEVYSKVTGMYRLRLALKIAAYFDPNCE